MILSLSESEARRFLLAYHFTPGDIESVFSRLGTVQYDPLNPVGRNPDLVLQARVPGYKVDHWQHYAYARRRAYDSWDKQACLVPISDWRFREPVRQRFHPWHDREVLDRHPDVVAAALAEVDARGPLSSLQFEDRTRAAGSHSWYGNTVIRRVLRALWARGELVTHHREGARHYYDRPDRVVPAEHYGPAPFPDLAAYFRWAVLRRHQVTGLLRPKAESAIWSVCGTSEERGNAIRDLVDAGDLIPCRVGAAGTIYHIPASALPFLDCSDVPSGVRFLAPLDSLLWDRRAVSHIFGFQYVWEVYKPAAERTWGYYVLPVLYGDRFVARFDSRLQDSVWSISKWWWEDGILPEADLLDALGKARERFVDYLGAQRVEVSTQVDRVAGHVLTAI